MNEFWNWMGEWGIPLLAIFIMLRLDEWRKARRKKKDDAEVARIHAEMSADHRRRNAGRNAE